MIPVALKTAGDFDAEAMLKHLSAILPPEELQAVAAELQHANLSRRQMSGLRGVAATGGPEDYLDAIAPVQERGQAILAAKDNGADYDSAYRQMVDSLTEQGMSAADAHARIVGDANTPGILGNRQDFTNNLRRANYGSTWDSENPWTSAGAQTALSLGGPVGVGAAAILPQMTELSRRLFDKDRHLQSQQDYVDRVIRGQSPASSASPAGRYVEQGIIDPLKIVGFGALSPFSENARRSLADAINRMSTPYAAAENAARLRSGEQADVDREALRQPYEAARRAHPSWGGADDQQARMADIARLGGENDMLDATGGVAYRQWQAARNDPYLHQRVRQGEANDPTATGKPHGGITKKPWYERAWNWAAGNATTADPSYRAYAKGLQHGQYNPFAGITQKQIRDTGANANELSKSLGARWARSSIHSGAVDRESLGRILQGVDDDTARQLYGGSKADLMRKYEQASPAYSIARSRDQAASQLASYENWQRTRNQGKPKPSSLGASTPGDGDPGAPQPQLEARRPAVGGSPQMSAATNSPQRGPARPEPLAAIRPKLTQGRQMSPSPSGATHEVS